MEKLSFLEAASVNRMTAAQMKQITGGGTCGYIARDASGETIATGCGMTKEEALASKDFWSSEGSSSSYWCCDSCPDSSYCS